MVFFNSLLMSVSSMFNKVCMLYTIHDAEFWQADGPGASFAFMQDFLVGLDKILLPFMFVACAVLSLYAVVLGVNLAKAENPSDAKKRIVGAVSTVIVVIVVIIILKFLLIPNMGNIFALIDQAFTM